MYETGEICERNFFTPLRLLLVSPSNLSVFFNLLGENCLFFTPMVGGEGGGMVWGGGVGRTTSSRGTSRRASSNAAIGMSHRLPLLPRQEAYCPPLLGYRSGRPRFTAVSCPPHVALRTARHSTVAGPEHRWRVTYRGLDLLPLAVRVGVCHRMPMWGQSEALQAPAPWSGGAERLRASAEAHQLRPEPGRGLVLGSVPGDPPRVIRLACRTRGSGTVIYPAPCSW